MLCAHAPTAPRIGGEEALNGAVHLSPLTKPAPQTESVVRETSSERLADVEPIISRRQSADAAGPLTLTGICGSSDKNISKSPSIKMDTL